MHIYHAVLQPTFLDTAFLGDCGAVSAASMSVRRFTRQAARAVEEQTISVKREQQSHARQTQQRAARQTNDTISLIHIDVDPEESPVLTATADLPPLEEQEERKENVAEEEERLQAILKQISVSFPLPPLEMPALLPSPPPPPPQQPNEWVKKEESKEGGEEQKEHTARSVSVKTEVQAKVEKKEKEEQYDVEAALSMDVDVEERKEGERDSDDEPIAMRLTRRLSVAPVVAAMPGRSRRVRRDRRAVQYDDSSSSDSDSDFEDEVDGEDGADDGEDDSDDDGDGDDEQEDDVDELDGDEAETISLSSGDIDRPPADDAPPLPLPPDETDLLLSSTSPSTFIAPFLHFAPPSVPPVTDRYCLTLALSSRSRCRRCREFIIAGYPRIGQQARLRTHLVTRWYHPSCWTLTAVDDGRQRVGGKLGALITDEERERVRQLEGRLERLDEYEALIAQLNEKERVSWKKSLVLLEKKKADIVEWKASGGVRRRRASTRSRTRKRRKRRTGKAKKAGKRKGGAESADEDEEWVPADEEQDERPLEEQKDEGRTRVKRERGVKREASVKRENGVKREPQVKEEKQVRVKVERRVKRERVENDDEKVDENEQKEKQAKRSKRAVKRE